MRPRRARGASNAHVFRQASLCPKPMLIRFTTALICTLQVGLVVVGLLAIRKWYQRAQTTLLPMHMSADAPSPSKLAMMSYFGKKTSRLDGYGQPRPHFLSTSTRTNNRREAMRLYAMFERFAPLWTTQSCPTVPDSA